MRLPYRRCITQLSEKELKERLEPHFGYNKSEPFIGFSVGPGWNDIILDLHKQLLKENPDYAILQVKEKFGTLRYYTNRMTSEGQLAIAQAENFSGVTCEECGRPGSLRDDDGWIVTLCDWDHTINKINRTLWLIQRSHLVLYWKIRFGINRWRKKFRKDEI